MPTREELIEEFKNPPIKKPAPPPDFYCPICKNKVKGTENTKFFCSTCNMLFSNESLLTDRDINNEENTDSG